jgi:putative endonuclease
MSRARRKMGMWGEKVAAEYLADRGYEILERNVRNSEGELDIVAKLGDCIVFVEVKTRGSQNFGSPEEALTASKQDRLRKTAWTYLEERECLDAFWRIDVVAIEGTQAGGVERLEHYEFAIGGGVNP